MAFGLASILAKTFSSWSERLFLAPGVPPADLIALTYQFNVLLMPLWRPSASGSGNCEGRRYGRPSLLTSDAPRLGRSVHVKGATLEGGLQCLLHQMPGLAGISVNAGVNGGVLPVIDRTGAGVGFELIQ